MSAYETSGTVAVPHACDGLAFALESPDTPFHYSPTFRAYSVHDRTGGTEKGLDFCPFCGAPFPLSLRDLYLDRFFDAHPDADLGDVPCQEGLRGGDAWWRDDPELTCAVVEIPVTGEQRFPRPCSPAEADLVAAACRMDPGGASPALFAVGRPVWFFPATRRLVADLACRAVPGTEFIQLETPDERLIAFLDVIEGRVVEVTWGETASSVWMGPGDDDSAAWRLAG